jgi:hypothetical protein
MLLTSALILLRFTAKKGIIDLFLLNSNLFLSCSIKINQRNNNNET